MDVLNVLALLRCFLFGPFLGAFWGYVFRFFCRLLKQILVKKGHFARFIASSKQLLAGFRQIQEGILQSTALSAVFAAFWVWGYCIFLTHGRIASTDIAIFTDAQRLPRPPISKIFTVGFFIDPTFVYKGWSL